jgi:hypothetical protein
MPETTSRQRVTAYQARIERTLTDIFHEVPQANQAGNEWILTSVAHTNGYASCELCGHTPIKRLFFIQSRSTGAERMIGSECARNYLSVDLVQAYERTLNRSMNRRRVNARREAAREQYIAQRAAQEAERVQRRAAWRTTNADVIAFLASYVGNDVFLTSVRDQLARYTSLTERQTTVVRERMASSAVARQNAADTAATPDQVPHIYNGTYTMDNGTRHLTFQIYTVTRGPLQGKRIVKRQLQYGEFQGFAFVNADGTLGVWRRFAEQSNELYMQWARILLSCLNARSNDAPGIDTLTHHLVEGDFTIQRTRACRRCNRQLTVPTSIESGIGPECARRDASANRTQVADAHADAATVFETAMSRPRVARVVPAVPFVRTEQLVLSELGTGMER